MVAIGGIVGFIVHALIIWAVATYVAKLESAGLLQSLLVALFSYVAMFLLSLVTVLFLLIPIVNVIVLALILFAGTAIAAKLVFGCDWEPAWTIGLFVAIAHAVLSFIL